MNVLVIGDIVGSPGRAILKKALPGVFARHDIDYCIANAENAAGGFGVTKEVCDELLDLGIDCLTSGNHIWDKKEIIGFVDLIPQLLRPANYPERQPGRGSHVGRSKRSGQPVATLNLSGRVFMNGALDDPFARGLAEVERLRQEARIIIVDMHGEATSEKQALGHYLDGKVSAVVGTHTHVPTCDHRILPHGTAYCSDIGMTGPYDSVIGVEKEPILQRFLTGMPTRFETAKGDPRLAAVVVDVDPETGRARGIDRMLLAEADLSPATR
jgi:metallophosphoesterase (TIGR00282 family)